jgi:hypothetical protein
LGCGFFYACYTEAMRFAEVFLRLGSSLVGWMLVYTYTVWLAALHVMGCGPDGDGMHRLLFGLAPFAVVMALPLRLTRPFPDIQRMLSWLGVPIILLLPFVLRNGHLLGCRGIDSARLLGARAISRSRPHRGADRRRVALCAH